MKKALLIALMVSALAAAGWSLYLVELHNDAIAQLLEPGALCGEDGGCGLVLGSSQSTLFGIPVSAPGLPLYFFIASFALLGLWGRVALDRISALATLSSGVGVIFGLYLLYHMLFSIGEICGYCLTMDGINLLILILALALHSGGPKGALTDLFGVVKRVFSPSLEALLLPTLLIGTALVHTAFPEPTEAEVLEAMEARDALGASSDQAGAPKNGAVDGKSGPENGKSAQGSGRHGDIGTPGKASTQGSGKKPGAKKPNATEIKTKRVVLAQNPQVVPLDASIPVKGNPNAPVTISLFEDFQCPFCSRLAGNIAGVMDVAGDEIKVAWYHFPMHKSCNGADLKKSLHPYACAAAKASFCAQKQDKFWEMHDILFRNNARLKDKDLRRYATDLGLNLKDFDRCMRSKEAEDKVYADSKIGADLGVRGTPTFFVNGRRMVGAQPVEVILAAAEAVKEAGENADRILLDVPLAQEEIGEVQGPSTVNLAGPDGAFKIDAFEASIIDGIARSQPGVEPARGVTWHEADQACKAAGKRLCTEGEWLAACTGAQPVDENGDGIYSNDPIRGRFYPYGNYQQETYCVSFRDKNSDKALITGNHPKCKTPEGVYDLEGLTKEWVGLSPDKASVKGGSYYSRASARCGYFKDSIAPTSSDNSIGFRCCEGDIAAKGTERYPGGKVGDSILDFQGTRFGGGDYGSADFKGKATILTFWASWCGPCRKELPALLKAYEKYKEAGLMVVGVNVDENPQAAEAFLKKMPLSFPVVLDTDHRIKDQFDTRGVPTTFWIDKSGAIKQRTVGYDPRDEAGFEANIQGILGH